MTNEKLKENLKLIILDQQQALDTITADGRVPVIPGIENVIIGKIQAFQDVLGLLNGDKTILGIYLKK